MKIGQRVPTQETHHRLPDTGGPNHPRSLPHDPFNGIPGTCSITIRPMMELHSKGLLVGLTFEPFFSVTYHPDHSWWRFDSWNAATELLRHQCARVILEQGLINQNCQHCTPLAVWGISPSCWLAQIQQQKNKSKSVMTTSVISLVSIISIVASMSFISKLCTESRLDSVMTQLESMISPNHLLQAGSARQLQSSRRRVLHPTALPWGPCLC